LHELHEFLTAESAEIFLPRRHEEKLDRMTGFLGTENTEVFSQLGVLGKLCSESELSPQGLALVHKAIEMAFLRSWRKRCFISHKKAKNAQKEQKNDQKLLFLVI